MYPKQTFCFWGIIILAYLTGCILLLIKYQWAYVEPDEYLDELMLDVRKAPSEAEMLELFKRELPTLPFEFLQRNMGKALHINSTCAPHPDLFELHLHNEYWQTFRNDNVTWQLYGAYYDKRVVLEHGPMVRILTMMSQIDEGLPTSYCQLWFDERSEPVIVPVSAYLPIWYGAWGKPRNFLYPHMLGCTLPAEVNHLIPQTVSLVAEECDRATNSLLVNFNELRNNATKQGFAICVKGMDYPFWDISNRLVEWLELMRILGAEKIFIYNLQMHANISKVLDYYVTSGLVELTPMSLVRGDSSIRNFRHMSMKKNDYNKCLHEVIPYNDCYYKHMYEYDYIAVVDLDEVIMPLGNLSNWRDIVNAAEESQQSLGCKKTASICFRNVYFPDNLSHDFEKAPRYLHMLQHVVRIANHSTDGFFVKCLHNTEHAVTIHNHYPLHWLECCPPMSVNVSQAQLQHYREPRESEDFQRLLQDANIWRFRKILVNRTRRVFSELGFYKKVNAPKKQLLRKNVLWELR